MTGGYDGALTDTQRGGLPAAGPAPHASAMQSTTDNRDRPVIIVGSGRSGTTFLAKLLDSHPDVLYRHEPDSVHVNTDIPFLPETDAATDPVLCSATAAYLHELLDVRNAKSAGHRPMFNKSFRSGGGERLFRASVYAAKAAGRLPLGLDPPVGDWLSRGTGTGPVYLIKSVNSVWRGKLFADALPAARIIHIVRHPGAVAASVLRGIEGGLMPDQVFLSSLSAQPEAARYPFSLEQLKALPYESQLAYQWLMNNQTLHDRLASHPHYRLVVYEDLCRDLKPQTAALFDFAGLDWDPQTDAFISRLNAQDTGDKKYFEIVRSPVASLDKWRDQLSDEQQDNVRSVVRHGDLMAQCFPE